MGSKRQLPPWMLRRSATDQVINSVSEVKIQENGLEELSTDPKSSVLVQQHVSEVLTCQSESTKTDDLCLVKKCKTTRSRRKPVKRAENDVGNMHEGDVEKENYAPPRRKRKAKELKATRSNAVEESTISEDELSVDDLINIAKEYIDADKKKEVQRSSLAECESERLLRSISFEDKTTLKDNTPSSVTTFEASSSDLVEFQPSEGGGDVISFSETGDIAQDMIELLLGPIFKRCSKVKPNPEPVTWNVTIEYSSSNQTRDELIGDAVPLARKKGSLKDKVALMLS